MQQIISIRDAEKAGLKHYFTGKPCKHGHTCERYVSTWRCVECTVSRVVDWQRKNPEKKRAKQRRYHERHKHKKLEWSRRDHETERQRIYKRRVEEAGRERPDSCELCGEPDPRQKIVWDHCHKGGHFRGWLCNRCNKTIGLASDSPNLLRKMADYLEQTASTKSIT